MNRGETVSYRIESGIDRLVDTVKLTLGPRGHTVILFDGAGKAFPTKDGITVASSIRSNDPTEEAAIQILREASSKTAKLAGDGTTTSLILAQALYKEGKEALASRSLPELKTMFNTCVDECKRLLKTKSFTRTIPFDRQHLSYVATTSANNDSVIGDMVADAFMQVGEGGVVNFDTEDVARTYIEVFEGSRYKLPIAAKEFFNSKTSLEAKYKDAYVLLFNNSIKDINNVAPALIKAAKDNKAIVIFADDFSELALSQMYTNVVQNTVQILPVRVTGYIGYKKDVYADLGILTGAKVVEKVLNDSMLGNCTKVTSSLNQTTLSVDEPTKEFEDRIKQLEEIIKAEKDQVMKGQYKERLNQLKGKIAVIHVGGLTDAEQKERYDRVEDAVCAVNAALEEGISTGGASTFIRLAEEIKDIDRPFYRALLTPFKQLSLNSSFYPKSMKITEDMGFNFLTGKYENLYDSGVIDPTKVIRLCIEHATSVALLLLSTEAVVYDED